MSPAKVTSYKLQFDMGWVDVDVVTKFHDVNFKDKWLKFCILAQSNILGKSYKWLVDLSVNGLKSELTDFAKVRYGCSK